MPLENTNEVDWKATNHPQPSPTIPISPHSRVCSFFLQTVMVRVLSLDSPQMSCGLGENFTVRSVITNMHKTCIWHLDWPKMSDSASPWQTADNVTKCQKARIVQNGSKWPEISAKRHWLGCWTLLMTKLGRVEQAHLCTAPFAVRQDKPTKPAVLNRFLS